MFFWNSLAFSTIQQMLAIRSLVLLSFQNPALQGSSVHGILQERILEWVATPFSRGSSRPRDQTLVSRIGRWILHRLEPPGNLCTPPEGVKSERGKHALQKTWNPTPDRFPRLTDREILGLKGLRNQSGSWQASRFWEEFLQDG